MKRIPLNSPSPSMAVAITALVLAMGGSGYAATQLTIGSSSAKHSASAKAAKKKKARRGPAGLQGAPGAPGAQGPAGSSAGGSTGAMFMGRMNTLNTAQNSDAYGSPSGISVAAAGISTNEFQSPNRSLTLKDFSVAFTSQPMGTAIRFFHLTVNGTDVSPGCTVLANQNTCSTTLNTPLPPLSSVIVHSSVSSGNAAPGDALFSWVAG